MPACRACQKDLPKAREGEYAFCPGCGSANLYTAAGAEEDNRAYFEMIARRPALTELKGRREQYTRFERIHKRIHGKSIAAYGELLGRIRHEIQKSSKMVEIGFGYGVELVQNLEAGINAYGLDLSAETVALFQRRYPQYADRVACGTHVDFEVDIIYSNALFEHLDEPGAFLVNARKMLKEGGKLILRMPVINRPLLSRFQADSDINYWKPCHRVLYTEKGLRAILLRNGFVFDEGRPFDYLAYKLMSRMLAHGFGDIEHIRAPLVPIEKLSDSLFLQLLVEALLIPSGCSDFAVVASKTEHFSAKS